MPYAQQKFSLRTESVTDGNVPSDLPFDVQIGRNLKKYGDDCNSDNQTGAHLGEELFVPMLSMVE